jgi:hypothetical protein
LLEVRTRLLSGAAPHVVSAAKTAATLKTVVCIYFNMMTLPICCVLAFVRVDVAINFTVVVQINFAILGINTC